MQLKGSVVSIELYGAFVDVGVEANAILHISKLGERVNRVSEVLSVGDKVDVWVETVDPGREQITITMIAIIHLIKCLTITATSSVIHCKNRITMIH